MAHLYFTFENIALSEAQRNSMTAALNLLGDNDHPNPSHRNHRVAVFADCIIYEGDFVEGNINEAAIDALLATALSVDVSTVRHAVYLSDYGRVAVFEHDDTLHCRIIYHDRDTAFGSHADSRTQVHMYKSARDAAVATSYTTVPHIVPDYDLDAGANWTLHPYNPANPYRLTSITSPATVIDVEADHAGDLQAAIDAIPAGGATLNLGAVYYSGEYSLTAQGNVHFIGQGQGVTSIRSIRIFGDEWVGLGATYPEFIAALKTIANPDHAAAISMAQNIPRNIYFKDLTFDGNGLAVTWVGEFQEDAKDMAVHFRAVEDILFDNVTFTNYTASPDTPKPHGPVVAHCLVDNIWTRGCTFNTTTKSAWYVDGAHGCGHIDCTFADTYPTYYLIYFTHDDVTEDVNENGTMEPEEIRSTTYMVAYRCTFENIIGAWCIIGHMGHCLILDNDIQGRWTKWAVEIVGRSSEDNLPAVHDHTDLQVANNTIGRMTHIMRINGMPSDDNETDGVVGQAKILANTIADSTGFIDWIEKLEDFAGQIVGPHVIAENVGGPA